MTQTHASKRATPRAADSAPARQRMIQVGTEVLAENGFSETGVDQILQRASAPKGSFYYYFESKQAFGLAVVANYEAIWERRLTRILEDPSMSPLTRIRLYIEEGMYGMEKYNFRRGCLIGNLGQELGGLNEAFRASIERVLEGWTRRMKVCLDEAVAQRELPRKTDTDAIAQFFWTAWEGAVLRCKLTRSVRPLENFSDVLFGIVLRVETPNVQ